MNGHLISMTPLPQQSQCTKPSGEAAKNGVFCAIWRPAFLVVNYWCGPGLDSVMSFAVTRLIAFVYCWKAVSSCCRPHVTAGVLSGVGDYLQIWRVSEVLKV